MTQILLPSTSATPSVELSFSPLELLAARCAVKRLIARGEWASRSDLMMLPDFVVEEIIDEEAVKFLQLQKAKRQGYEAKFPAPRDDGLGELRQSLEELPKGEAGDD